MTKVIVSDKALRELVREALDGGHLGDLTMPDEDFVNVNNVVDPSATVTDPINPNFVPQTKPELDVAVKQLTKDVPIDKVSSIYKALMAAINAEEAKTEEDEEMTKAAKGGSDKVEEAVRLAVRKMIKEMAIDPADLDADEDETEMSVRNTRAYKSTAMGGMDDVGGASFEEIAKHLGFSVAGAKQAVDKALEKARFLGTMDQDEKEILILTSMNDYIKYLSKSGELSPADVQLLKDHPEIVRELEGFREFLHNAVRRARKGTKLESPLGEAAGIESKWKGRSYKKGGEQIVNLKDKSKNVEVDPAYGGWGGQADECPKCHGTNTKWGEEIPSMMGHGTDSTLICNDCKKEFPVDPFSGEFNESIKRSIKESKSPPKCADCKKPMKPSDKSEYEAEGGEGYPRICTRCAEEPG